MIRSEAVEILILLRSLEGRAGHFFYDFFLLLACIVFFFFSTQFFT